MMTTEEFKKEMIKLMEKVENSEELTSEEVNYIVRKVDRTSDLYLLFNQNYEIIQNLNPMDGMKAISYKKLHESKNDLEEDIQMRHHVKEMTKEELNELKRKMENSEELLSVLASDEIEYILSNVDKNLIEINSLLEKNYILIGDPNLGIRAIPKNEYEFEIEKDMDSIEENVAKMLNEDLENELAGFVPPSLEELENNIELLKSEQSLLKVICDAFHITTTEFTEFKTIKGLDLKTGKDFYEPDLYKFKHEKDLFRFCDLIEGIKIKIERELEENRSNYLIITATGIDILHKYGSLYNEFSDNGAHEITDINSKVILKSIYDKYTKDIQQELDITDDYILTLTSTIKLCKDIIKIAKKEFYDDQPKEVAETE